MNLPAWSTAMQGSLDLAPVFTSMQESNWDVNFQFVTKALANCWHRRNSVPVEAKNRSFILGSPIFVWTLCSWANCQNTIVHSFVTDVSSLTVRWKCRQKRYFNLRFANFLYANQKQMNKNNPKICSRWSCMGYDHTTRLRSHNDLDRSSPTPLLISMYTGKFCAAPKIAWFFDRAHRL